MKQKKEHFSVDRLSFQLGMINCFVEMVACGVKKLALSPPLLPEDFEVVGPASQKMVEEFGIKSYLEKNLLITDLQAEEFTRNKWSLLYYKTDKILESYLELKKKKRHLEKEGKYNKKARQKISQEFMRLLSYPEEVIQEKLNQKSARSPYMLIKEE
ncbi:MAG: hypothetical protein JXB26_17710 [Candidatus Aminicenantes bacterium]|nr:hypothetical protein [Candidatus Aminicenantes bacterium]